MTTDTDYTHGFQQALAGFPLVSDIDASYSGAFITGWLDGRESSRKTPIKNEYTVSLTATFPFATMPVDGSFVVPRAIAVNASGAAALYKRAHRGWSCETASVPDGLMVRRVR